MLQISILSPVHTFCDSILMRSGKCCKYKSSTVWASLINLHSCTFLINLTDMWHIRKIDLRIHALGIHIHTQCYNIHITGTLAISKESTLNSVSACQKAHLGICNTASTVIVRMKGNDYVFTVFQIVTHVFHLACIHMRHGMFNSNRQVDDCLVIFRWLPYIKNCVANFQCIFRLCSCKTLRAVLKLEVTLCLICQFFQKSCAIYRNLQDLFFGFLKYLLSLRNRCGIVYMNDRFRSTLYGLKSFADDVLSCLSQYLNGNILRNQVLFDQGTKKLILCL